MAPAPQPSAVSPAPLAWFWAPLADALLPLRRRADAPVTREGPAVVLGRELFDLPPEQLAPESLFWLIDTPDHLAKLEERHLAALARIYSPLLAEEFPPLPNLAAPALGALLSRVHFVPRLPGATPNGVELSSVALREPLPVVVWQYCRPLALASPEDFVAAAAILAAAEGSAGYWLLPQPLNRLSPARLALLQVPGRTLLPCTNLRTGVQAAIRLAHAPRKAAPLALIPTLVEDTSLGPRLATFQLPAAEIAARLHLALPGPAPAPLPAGRLLSDRIAAWPADGTSLAELVQAFRCDRGWDQPDLLAPLATALDSAAPLQRGAFAATLLAAYPLTELYHQPGAEVQAAARCVLRLLAAPASAVLDPTQETIRLLAQVVLGDAAGFAHSYEAAVPVLGPRYTLSALALAGFGRLAWTPPPTSALAGAVAANTGETVLAAALALAEQNRVHESDTLLAALHATLPDFLVESARHGRWHRLLLWARLARHANAPAAAAAARRWVRLTDLTYPDQVFLLDRPLPASTGSLHLPPFALPGEEETPIPAS